MFCYVLEFTPFVVPETIRELRSGSGKLRVFEADRLGQVVGGCLERAVQWMYFLGFWGGLLR